MAKRKPAKRKKAAAHTPSYFEAGLIERLKSPEAYLSQWRRGIGKIIKPYLRGPISSSDDCHDDEADIGRLDLGDGPSMYAIPLSMLAEMQSDNKSNSIERLCLAINAETMLDLLGETQNASVYLTAAINLGQCFGELKYRTEIETLLVAERVRGGKNSGVWTSDDRKSFACKVFNAASKDRSQHKALLATQRQLGIEFPNHPRTGRPHPKPALKTVRRMVGLAPKSASLSVAQKK